MRAALALVAERGSTNIAVSDIAHSADVSRQLVYQQFGDRDTLLLEAALDQARRELLPRVSDDSGEGRVLAAARHFAAHRSFYRAMLTGPCAFALNKALSALLAPANQELVRRMSPTPLDPELMADVTMFVTGGWAAIVNTWLIEGEDPLDAEALASRLLRIVPVLVGTAHETEALGESD